MLASVQGPEPAGAGSIASSRRLARALALAAVLLVAALAAPPAWAQDAAPVPVADPGGSDSSGTPPSDSQPVSAPDPDPATAPDPGPVVRAPEDPAPSTATPDAPPTGESPSGDSLPGGDGGGDDHASHKQPAHGTENGAVPTSPAGSTSATLSPSATPDPGDQSSLSQTASGSPDSWLGQDTFVVDEAGGSSSAGNDAAYHGSLASLLRLGAPSRASRLEAKARRSLETAKVSALGGPPGSGKRLPGQNPFFNLLSGPGGVAAGLALASIFAVLGAAFVLPRHRSRVFRTPTVSWRPLAYVPPIELPG